MHLAPKLPPGRPSRRALAFAAEIHRLRVAGYSYESIRLALLDAGVVVSRSTVRREAAKRRGTLPTAQAMPTQYTTRPATPPSQHGDVGSDVLSYARDVRTGKEIAEAFVKDRITNPLLQRRKRDQSRSD